MSLSKREFLQVLGAASVAGMGLARYVFSHHKTCYTTMTCIARCLSQYDVFNHKT